MASVRRHLVDRDQRLVKLFTPPFDRTTNDPGYIRSYPPGLRENGGQYSHAAMWTILATAQLGDGGGAVDLFDLLNPINHALTPAAAAHYRVEPYAVAADIYSVPPHDGRGGWTWYTGAAGWMFRAGVEGIIGLRRIGGLLRLDPRLPEDWLGVSLDVRIDDAHYAIEIKRTGQGGTPQFELDGTLLESASGPWKWLIEPGSHVIRVSI